MRISDWSSDVCSSDPQVCESVAHPRYGEGSPMNQSVDGKGRAAINVHQAQLSPLQIAEGSHVGVNATGCKRPNAHTSPGKLDGKRSEERRVGKECVRKCRHRGAPTL